jgi:hypothetical protein
MGGRERVGKGRAGVAMDRDIKSEGRDIAGERGKGGGKDTGKERGDMGM